MDETFRGHPRSRAGELESEQARGRLLIGAAAACVILWIGSLCAAAVGLGGVALAALAIGGFSLTIVILTLILREQRRLRDLAAVDSLTGLTNHGGFHQT